RADGTDRRVIYAGPLTEDMAGPAWSPQGDPILVGVGGFFQRAQYKPAQLMAIHADGTGPTLLMRDSISVGMPSWSPDGRRVVYRAASGMPRQLYIRHVATGAPQEHQTHSTFDSFPACPPSG